MLEAFEQPGNWWLLDDPDNVVAGVVSFEPTKGTTLELIGSFNSSPHRAMTSREPVIILGTLTDGKIVTLQEAFSQQSTLSMRGVTTTSYFANLMLIGAHASSKQDFLFTSISARFTHLDAWVNHSGFSHEDLEGSAMSILYKPIDPIPLYASDEFDIFADISYSYSFQYTPESVKIEQYSSLRVEPSGERSLEVLLEILQKIREVISLAVVGPINMQSVVGKSNHPVPGIEFQAASNPINVYFPQNKISSPAVIHSHSMLFDLPTVEDAIQDIFSQWFSKREILGPACDLYFSTVQNPQLYLDNRFLNIAQALESYHRRTNNHTELPSEAHKERIDAILENAPEQYRAWLKDELYFSNELSLHVRLEEVTKTFSAFTNYFIPDVQQFIRTIKHNRNYRTHYSSSLERHSLKGELLFQLVERMKTLLELCLLSELGFSHDNLLGFLNKRSQHLNWVNRLSE